MKILLVDDHPLILAALQTVILGLRSDVKLLATDNASDARAALAGHPDIDLVLLDLSLGDDDGFEVLAEFRTQYPAVPVVVISASERSADVIRAVDLGCMGYIPKRLSSRGLRDALYMVMTGGLYMPAGMLGLFSHHIRFSGDAGGQHRTWVDGDTQPAALLSDGAEAPARGAYGGDTQPGHLGEDSPVAQHARAEPHQSARQRLEDVGLTPRQTEVLSLLLQGLPNKLIARQLNLSVETVKDHVAAVLRALGVSSRTQAVLAVSQMTQGQGGVVARRPAPL
ncbi:MAG: response regulator [Rubrivivax sp.]